jgi:hypothetical protein
MAVCGDNVTKRKIDQFTESIVNQLEIKFDKTKVCGLKSIVVNFLHY